MSKTEPFRGEITSDSYQADPQHKAIADSLAQQFGIEPAMINRIVISDDAIDIEYFKPARVGDEPRMIQKTAKRRTAV